MQKSILYFFASLGKKLPIWKKRENPAPAITTTQDNPEEKLNLTNVSTRNYGKFAKEQIKMPRQLREIQENLNFEKVRSQTVSDSNKEDMNIDEIKEFMDEQRRNDVDDEASFFYVFYCFINNLPKRYLLFHKKTF